jgi:hypothetical protein
MTTMTTTTAAEIVCIALLGLACAGTGWAPGPGSGLSEADFERDHALCSDQARVEVSNAQDPNDAVARMHAYRDCLKAKGWVKK